MHTYTYIIYFNAATALLLALLCAWAVLSPRVRDGIVIKLGLIGMSLGFFVTFWAVADGMDCDDLNALARAGLLTRGGLLIVIAGWAWRVAHTGHALRRANDWEVHEHPADPPHDKAMP
ncbi:MAG: hypothetical protein H7242_16310 [Microbacteriaceae bacterium]|nr:hypothetical protein [Burkholderiaceae bacterium]